MRTISVPLGRLSDYRNKPDANLYLIKPGRGIFDNETLIRFSTRKALEAFSKKNGLRALVPTQVPLNCAVWAFQSDNEARKEHAAQRTVEALERNIDVMKRLVDR